MGARFLSLVQPAMICGLLSPLLFFSLVAASIDLLPSILGRYNVTFAIISVPLEHAASLVKAEYAKSILPPDPTLYPGIGDNVPIFLELGREANAGPLGLQISNFQEAKIEVPNIKRVEDADTPFLYKRWIAVDDDINVFGSWLQFGLNTSKEVFTPSNSSDSPSYDYTIAGAVEATFEEVDSIEFPLTTFQAIGGQPWFAEYPTCAQHSYNESVVPVTYLKGDITLFPPYAGANATGPATFEAQAVHGLFDFTIVGAVECLLFL